MRTLVATPGGRMRWRRVPSPPPPGPLGAVVHPIAIATCDMDRPIALGATPFPMPLCFGHECVAEVLRVGAEVRDVEPGDRVVVPFQISCGECGPCRDGRTSNCLSVPPISMYGFGLAGGHWGGVIADEVAVPFADGMLVPLPAGVDPVAAASVADNVSDAYRHIGPNVDAFAGTGRRSEVLVMGSPTRRTLFTASVPLYAALIARALGAERVTLADARPAVRRAAADLGVEAVALSELGGPATAPLVADISAHPKGLRKAIEITAPDGVCSSSGGLHRSVTLPFSAMYGRNVTLRVARANARTMIPEVLALMADGRLRPELVTTQLAPIDEAIPALDVHMRGGSTKTILVAE
jgi:alcohol dehydrogenase